MINVRCDGECITRAVLRFRNAICFFVLTVLSKHNIKLKYLPDNRSHSAYDYHYSTNYCIFLSFSGNLGQEMLPWDIFDIFNTQPV